MARRTVKRRSRTGLKKGTKVLKKGYRYARGGRVVKAKSAPKKRRRRR